MPALYVGELQIHTQAQAQTNTKLLYSNIAHCTTDGDLVDSPFCPPCTPISVAAIFQALLAELWFSTVFPCQRQPFDTFKKNPTFWKPWSPDAEVVKACQCVRVTLRVREVASDRSGVGETITSLLQDAGRGATRI